MISIDKSLIYQIVIIIIQGIIRTFLRHIILPFMFSYLLNLDFMFNFLKSLLIFHFLLLTLILFFLKDHNKFFSFLLNF